MGLTNIADISVLYEKLEELQASLEEKEAYLQEQLLELQEIIFDGVILQEKDASWDVIRKKRDYLLKVTDWTMTPDASIDQAQWAAYRQILRDLPQTFEDSEPEEVIWPKQPSAAGPNSIPVE